MLQAQGCAEPACVRFEHHSEKSAFTLVQKKACFDGEA